MSSNTDHEVNIPDGQAVTVIQLLTIALRMSLAKNAHPSGDNSAETMSILYDDIMKMMEDAISAANLTIDAAPIAKMVVNAMQTTTDLIDLAFAEVGGSR